MSLNCNNRRIPLNFKEGNFRDLFDTKLSQLGLVIDNITYLVSVDSFQTLTCKYAYSNINNIDIYTALKDWINSISDQLIKMNCYITLNNGDYPNTNNLLFGSKGNNIRIIIDEKFRNITVRYSNLRDLLKNWEVTSSSIKAMQELYKDLIKDNTILSKVEQVAVNPKRQFQLNKHCEIISVELEVCSDNGCHLYPILVKMATQLGYQQVKLDDTTWIMVEDCSGITTFYHRRTAKNQNSVLISYGINVSE